MKWLLIALMCAGVTASLAPARATTLRWYGQACFEIVSDSGTRVLIDPFGAQVGYPVPAWKADVVLVSHEHADHNNVAAVGGKPEVFHGLRMGPEAHRVRGVTFRAVRTAHDAHGGKDRGLNTVFVLTVDGITFAHCGDLGHLLTPEQARAIGAVDVLMVPVGSVFTIDGTQAAAVAGQVRPRLVIPMHYKTPALKIALEGPEKFLAAAKAAGWTVKPAPRGPVRLTRAALPKATTVMVLDYK